MERVDDEWEEQEIPWQWREFSYITTIEHKIALTLYLFLLKLNKIFIWIIN